MILSGKELALKIRNEVKKTIDENNIETSLSVILIGFNKASEIYVRNKRIACQEAGIKFMLYDFPEDIDQERIIELIENLNMDHKVTSILVQLPLPKHMDELKIIQTISQFKDVDGFNAANVGALMLGKPVLAPCTAIGILELLKHYQIEIDGKHCVIIGRSNDVGKPLASLMLNNNATVTVCHSHTKNLIDITKTADILISAVGRAKFIKSDMIKEGSTLIDVGINRINGKIYGDIDFDDCMTKAANISPVPGGVGPMTVSMLTKNCIKSYELQPYLII